MRKIDRIRNHLERVHHDDHRLYQSEYDDYKLIIELAELDLKIDKMIDPDYSYELESGRRREILNQLEAEE